MQECQVSESLLTASASTRDDGISAHHGVRREAKSEMYGLPGRPLIATY